MATAAIHTTNAVHAAVPETHHLTIDQVLEASTRAVLVLTVILFAAVGFVTLTSPLAVPFTVFMWLCAAGFAGLVAFWRPQT
jgi:type IV secretory pathway TrbD component